MTKNEDDDEPKGLLERIRKNRKPIKPVKKLRERIDEVIKED